MTEKSDFDYILLHTEASNLTIITSLFSQSPKETYYWPGLLRCKEKQYFDISFLYFLFFGDCIISNT